MINPAVLLVGTPALVFVGWELFQRWRGQRRGDVGVDAADTTAGEVPIVALAWFIGTFAPFVVLSLAFQRTSYLYYMVVVMPGIYLGAAYVVWRARRYRRLRAVWWIVVVGAAIVMYPFTPLP
jgi:hypothetical protein